MASAPDTADLLCPECGYSLRGLTSSVCPECGENFEKYLGAASALPWLAARRPGFVAFWRTFAIVVFGRTRRLRVELVRSVDYRRTRLFAWLAAAHAWLATPIALWIWWLGDTSSFNEVMQGLSPTLAGVTAVAILPWLLLLSGVQTYFYHPRRLPVEMQNRTLALGYLAAAPLAALTPGLLLITGMFFALASYDSLLDWRKIEPELLLIVAVGWTGVVFLCYYGLCGAMAGSLTRSTARGCVVALLMPLLGAFLAALTVVFIPLVVAYLWLVWNTL
ncbi:MAG: hypothetical protein IT450_00805 [Phycisphaerales bacterium]|nr:hypothetical protein [Phycisphaerales bacterium]